MAIKSIGQSQNEVMLSQEWVSQNNPKRTQEKYSTLVPNAAKNISKMAIPTIALYALSSISGASALPPCYVACVGVCTGGGTAIVFPPAVLACLSGCIPLMACPFC